MKNNSRFIIALMILVLVQSRNIQKRMKRMKNRNYRQQMNKQKVYQQMRFKSRKNNRVSEDYDNLMDDFSSDLGNFEDLQ